MKKNHPELQDGEVFLNNYSIKEYVNLSLITKRIGKIAYNDFGIKINENKQKNQKQPYKINNEKVYPVFVNRNEIGEKYCDVILERPAIFEIGQKLVLTNNAHSSYVGIIKQGTTVHIKEIFGFGESIVFDVIDENNNCVRVSYRNLLTPQEYDKYYNEIRQVKAEFEEKQKNTKASLDSLIEKYIPLENRDEVSNIADTYAINSITNYLEGDEKSPDLTDFIQQIQKITKT